MFESYLKFFNDILLVGCFEAYWLVLVDFLSNSGCILFQ